MLKRMTVALLSAALMLASLTGPASAEARPDFIVGISEQIEARRKAIWNSADEATVMGTSYYVSAEGDDVNDGLTPETSWRTVTRVNEAELAEGDGVFFRRGDLWRGDMIISYREGITYAAYGTGAKPAFYGSPENGGGASKWTLMEGTDDVWVYEKPMPFLGSIVMNGGQAVATQHLSYWKGKEYVEYGTDDEPVDIPGIADMTYFSDVDLTAWDANPDHHLENGDLAVYDCNETGTLYLRCVAGNPGALYDEIEFGVGWGHNVGGGSTVDNLCVQYVGNCGIMSDPSSPRGMTVTNCEIGFMGDIYLNFEREEKHGVPGGEGFGFNGYGSVCRNNYVHDGRDGGFTIELGWDATVQDGQKKLGGMTATGNLFERNNGGVGIINFLERNAPIEISDILIDDNYFVKTGYCNTFTEGVEESVACIHVWFAGDWDALTGTVVSNNLFYLAYPKLVNLLNIGNAQIDFEGNVYVQGMYHKALTYAPTYDTAEEILAGDERAFAAAVADLLGDTTGRTYCWREGLENAEIDRAQALGILPEDVPTDLTQPVTSVEMTALLTKLVTLLDGERVPEWRERSALAAASDAPLTGCDGMVAVYEAALTLGLAQRNAEWWPVFQRINEAHDAWEELNSLNWDLYANLDEAGTDPDNPDFSLFNGALTFACGRWNAASNTMLFDYDDSARTLHGNEPLSWDAAIRACVRLADSADANSYRYYLAQ